MRSSLLQFPSHFLYFFSAFNLVHQFQVTEKYLTKVRHLTSSQKERTKNTYIFIMWKSSLVEIAKRARKTSAPPALQSVVKNVVADSQVPQVAALHQAGAIFSQTSEALVASQADFQTTLRSSILQSSLTSAEPLLRAADDTNTLLQQAQKLPFLYAQEAFCALVKAGEIQLAIQLVSFWQFKRPKSLKSSRRNAKKELLSTIQTLEALRDVTTLKALISLLSDSLKEQVFAENKTFTAVALTHVSSGPPRMQNRLFSLLGVAETSHVLTSAVEAAFRMGKGDGLSVFEKVLLADQCASCARSANTPKGTPHLPFPLYCHLQSLQAEEKLDADFIRQVCPELTAKLVHPSHYCTLDFLALTTGEARYIADNWKTREAFSSLSSASTAEATAWQRLLRCALPQSPALQSVEENILLLSLQTRKSAQVPSTDEQTRIKLTSSVNRLLRSPENPVRRFVALTLLKNRNLVAALKISPVKVASVYAGSFYSKGSVDPALCTLCGIVARRLSRKGCHQEAARLLWNHLSVDCPATRRFFRANPGAVDFAVLSMSVAMRDACDNGGGQKWMGYRSLALLTHAALSSDRLTVLHCVPVCVHAMECGVPFAAINGALAGIFHDDPTLGKWALNLVRLCSLTETVPLRLQQTNCGIASEFRRLLSNLCGANGVPQGEPLIRSASRSKQLVLWGCINDTTTNPRLNALMLATFLCESARDAILNCSFLEKSTGSVTHGDEKGKLPPTAEDVWNWEVAASVASNCTSPENYQAFLKCLRQRNPKLVQRRPMDLDCVSALLFSEMDGHDSLSSKQIITEK